MDNNSSIDNNIEKTIGFEQLIDTSVKKDSGLNNPLAEMSFGHKINTSIEKQNNHSDHFFFAQPFQNSAEIIKQNGWVESK